MADHDTSYKLLFSHKEMVADLVRGFVPGDWVDDLHLDTLERVSENTISADLREREDDLIWRLRWGERWLYLYLLLEFQSTIDRFMAVRLLTYIGLLYQDLAAAKALPRGMKLPPVLPIVLYNGEARWWAKSSVQALSEPNLPETLQHWQPQLRYLLLSEKRYDNQALEQLTERRNLVAALFQLEKSRTPDDIQCVLVRLVEWLRSSDHLPLRRAFVVWLKRVILPARAPEAEIPDVVELQEMQTVLAERVKGWVEEWKEMGLKQGLEQGVHLGETKLLRRLLTRRFGKLPAWAEERLQSADEATLEHWAEQILECESLEALLQ